MQHFLRFLYSETNLIKQIKQINNVKEYVNYANHELDFSPIFCRNELHSTDINKQRQNKIIIIIIIIYPMTG